MFCPKCGNELPEGALFCSSCGLKLDFIQENNESSAEQKKDVPIDPYQEEPVFEEDIPAYHETDYDDYYQEDPAPKKSRKPLIIALCAVVAAVVVLGVVFASGALDSLRGTPSTKLKNAATKTIDSVSQRSEVLGLMRDLKNSDKFGVSIKLENIGQMLSTVSPYMSYLNMDAQFDAAADKKMNLSATVNIEGFGIEAKAGIYSSENGDRDIVVDLPSILKDPFGISFKTISEDLDKSVFAPGSDSDYEIPESSYDPVKEMLESLGTVPEFFSEEDLRELTKEIQKNEETRIELTKGKEETDAGDRNVKCTVYTAKIDEKKLSAIIKYAGDWMDKNSDLDENRIISQALRSMGVYSMGPSDLIEELVDQVSESDLDLEIRYYIYKGYLVKTAVSGEIMDHELSSDITFGSDPSKTEEIVVRTEAEGNGTFTVKLDLSKADQNILNASLKSKENNVSAKFGFEYDKERSKFKLSASNGQGSDVLISGKMKLEKNTIILSDPVMSENSMGEIELDGLSVTFTGDPVIKKLSDDYPDGYKNILKLSEDEFEDAFDDLQSLGSAMGNLFG